MDNYKILCFIILLVFYLLNTSYNVEGIENNDDDDEEDHYYDIVDDYLSDIHSSNLPRNNCQSNESSGYFHTCDIQDSTGHLEEYDSRFIHIPPSELNTSVDYQYMKYCPNQYPSINNELLQKTSLGQYPGFTKNAYIDRIRYAESDDPLPTNPDFFMDGGGTYA